MFVPEAFEQLEAWIGCRISKAFGLDNVVGEKKLLEVSGVNGDEKKVVQWLLQTCMSCTRVDGLNTMTQYQRLDGSYETISDNPGIWKFIFNHLTILFIEYYNNCRMLMPWSLPRSLSLLLWMLPLLGTSVYPKVMFCMSPKSRKLKIGWNARTSHKSMDSLGSAE